MGDYFEKVVVECIKINLTGYMSNSTGKPASLRMTASVLIASVPRRDELLKSVILRFFTE